MIPALAGGALIGLSALLLYAALGRIAGISGIAFGALDAGSRAWRLPFLAGLMGGGWVAVLLGAPLPFAALPNALSGLAVLTVAGMLVGIGTRLGSGCTSGHGICGLSRLSPRSLAAVAVFMSVGIVTATFLRRVLI
ncbi:MAG: YeeE/YedE family protein [Pseudomonadota bacterium]